MKKLIILFTFLAAIVACAQDRTVTTLTTRGDLTVGGDADITGQIQMGSSSGLFMGANLDEDIVIYTLDRLSDNSKGLFWDESDTEFEWTTNISADTGRFDFISISGDRQAPEQHSISGADFTFDLNTQRDGTNTGLVGGLAIDYESTVAALAPAFYGFRANGTNGSKIAVASGDYLARFWAGGWDGTDYEPGAEIRFTAAATATSNDLESQMEFYTNPGGQTLTLGMTLDKDANLSVENDITALSMTIEDASANTLGSLYEGTYGGLLSLFEDDGGNSRLVAGIDASDSGFLTMQNSSGTETLEIDSTLAEFVMPIAKVAATAGTKQWEVNSSGIMNFGAIAGTAVANGATSITLTKNYMRISQSSGTSTISTITGGQFGVLLIIETLTTGLTITDDDTHTADTVDLDSTLGDFVSADDHLLYLIHNGTNWHEISRSQN